MNPYAGYVLSSPFRTKTDITTSGTPTVTATPVATTEDTTEDITEEATEEVTATKTGGRIGTTIGGIGMTGEISIMGSIKGRAVTSTNAEVVTTTKITAEEITTTADITIRKGPVAAVSDFIHECLSSFNHLFHDRQPK